jgi:hypothetical protein
MKNYFALILIFISLITSFAQETENYILTKDQNENWISEFRHESLFNKIDLLKRRILSDQHVYWTPTNPHGKTRIKEGFDTLTYVRPLYFFKTNNSKPFFLPGNVGPKMVEELIEILNSYNIDSISVEDENVEVLYGVRSTYGAITIVLKNEEQYSKLKLLAHNNG